MSLHTFCRTCIAFILVEIDSGHDFSRPNYCGKCKVVEPASEKNERVEVKNPVDFEDKSVKKALS